MKIFSIETVWCVGYIALNSEIQIMRLIGIKVLHKMTRNVLAVRKF